MRNQAHTDGTGMKIDIRDLSTVIQFADEGTAGVEEKIEKLNDEATSHVRRVDFYNLVERQAELDEKTKVAIRTRLKTEPGGHLLVMFDLDSAQKITGLVLSNMVDNLDDVSQEMARSAAEELGNMMISGFVNGAANFFDGSIDHSPPTLVHAQGSEIVKQAATMGDNRYTFKFDVDIQTNGDVIPTEVHLLPNLPEFVPLITGKSDYSQTASDSE